MEANNMAAMREALVRIRCIAKTFMAATRMRHVTDSARIDVGGIEELANSALSAPARNCDVGTPYEQANRMRQFCAKQKRNGIVNCGYCPIKHQYQRDCTLAWAQMPYAEEGAGK